MTSKSQLYLYRQNLINATSGAKIELHINHLLIFKGMHGRFIEAINQWEINNKMDKVMYVVNKAENA